MDPFLTIPFVIQRVKKETSDTVTLEILRPDDRVKTHSPAGSAFSFLPGQFNMLYVLGIGEIPVSISGDPNHPEKLFHTVRKVGAVSIALSLMEKGDRIGIRGPFGNPWPVNKAQGMDLLLMAGGIGLAPIRPVLYQVFPERDRYNRIGLLYGTRAPEDILYESEIKQWRSKFDLEVLVTVDRAAGDWKGNTGVVTTLISKVSFDPDRTLVMICGPEVMMRFSCLELQKKGVKPENIFVSMERNMKCSVGFCGHCQFGPWFVCKDGPIFSYDQVKDWIGKREI